MTTPATLDLLRSLIALPTVSRDPNRPLIDWVAGLLENYGIGSTIIPDSTGKKANLLAVIGPRVEGGLVFSGHTDVVPVDGQQWSSDPFQLSIRDGRAYGRGTADMKGFIAAVLSRVPQWTRAKLSRPIYLMFSYDEEVGCLGAPVMIAEASRSLPTPKAVIVGEPTSMRLANTHKGICLHRTRIQGVAAHSSLVHRGASAVMIAGNLISVLSEAGRAARDRASPDSPFRPPHTSISANTIQGGTAVNILAADCEFTWDIRVLPGEDVLPIRQQLDRAAAAEIAEQAKRGVECSVATETLADVPALTADSPDAERLALSALAEAHEPEAFSGATEAGQFRQAGWPSVICGPGSLDQAHKADEFVTLDQLQLCEVFLDRLVAQQCGG